MTARKPATGALRAAGTGSGAGPRTGPVNPNHHLWNNHGTWFLHYTIYPSSVTKERVRRSLGTHSVEVARQRRDEFLAGLARVHRKVTPATPAYRAAGSSK